LEALHKFAQKQIILPPPTYLTLLELSKYNTIEQVVEASKNRNLNPIQPHILLGETEGTFVCCLPGDCDHHDSVSGSKSKNRMYVTSDTIITEYTLDDDTTTPTRAAL